MGVGTSMPRQLSRVQPLDRRFSWQAGDGWISAPKILNTALAFAQNELGSVTGSNPLYNIPNAPQQQVPVRIQDEIVVEQKPPPNVTVEAETRQIGDGLHGIAVDHHAIMEKVSELHEGEYFVDDEFLPDNEALYYSGQKPDMDIDWMSPRQITSQPQMLVDGITRDDIMQGRLADCWFLSSCAAVSQKQDFINKVVPERQPLFGPGCKGIVHLRFWRFGEWVDVYVDDKLPISKSTKELIYGHCRNPNEFWVAFAEKAYAKLHGSYEAIEGGQAMDALVDLTGGIGERYELSTPHKDLYVKLAKACASGAFITCSKKGDWKSHDHEFEADGLIAGHAYTVTDVKRIKRKTGAEALIRVRNPWGIGSEWNGCWADGDHRWTLVDGETKKWLNFVEKADGEFWMSFKDFVSHFSEVTICTMGPDFDGDMQADSFGCFKMLPGKWDAERSAGGSRNDIHMFATNPQFLLTIYECDDKDPTLLKGEPKKDTSSVVVALMQEHRRSVRSEKIKMLQIAFFVYKQTLQPKQRLSVDQFLSEYETAKSGTFVNFREVAGRFELTAPGKYVIVPCTFNKDEVSNFLLRVYSVKKFDLE